MNRLLLGIALSGVFHLALLGWYIPTSDALPRVNVNPGKTSIAVKMQRQPQNNVSKPEVKEVEEPKKKPDVKPKEIEQPEYDKPSLKNVSQHETKQDRKPVDVKEPNPPEPSPRNPTPKPRPEKKELDPVQKPSVAKKGAEWVKQADYRSNPSPKYPESSRERGEEGTVILRVKVDKEGKPEKINIEESSGHPRLDEEAIKTVKSWRFTPAEHSGVKIRSTVLIPIRFQLDD